MSKHDTLGHATPIDGPHVRLRPAMLNDRRRIYIALARSDLTDILLGHPSQGFTPLLSYEAFCEDYKHHYFDDSHPEAGRCFVIEVDGRAVGQVNYNQIERDKARTELDIWMFAACHCGHGTEALGLLCDDLRNRFNVSGFYMKPSAANPRAIRAFEKAGFSRRSLSTEAARAEYGEQDTIDTVYMTRRIEERDPGGGRQSP